MIFVMHSTRDCNEISLLLLSYHPPFLFFVDFFRESLSIRRSPTLNEPTFQLAPLLHCTYRSKHPRTYSRLFRERADGARIRDQGIDGAIYVPESCDYLFQYLVYYLYSGFRKQVNPSPCVQ